jgi:hypothetical protein
MQIAVKDTGETVADLSAKGWTYAFSWTSGQRALEDIGMACRHFSQH